MLFRSNFYVPAGGDIPDPQTNEKFAHKLHFLAEMERFFSRRKSGKKDAVILVGDLNVAPLENDVWSHRQMRGIVSHTDVERRLLGEALAAFDWVDSTRHFIPPEEKIYSWWSYRAQDFRKSARGLRLDHILVSPGLREAAFRLGAPASRIHDDVRAWERPSDHAPVSADLLL